MIDEDLLKIFTGVSKETFELETDEELDNLLTEFIGMAKSLIEDYCNRDFGDDPPRAVKNVCLRLAANIVVQAVARQDTDLTRSGEYSTKITDSKVFTQDLKDDLRPYLNNMIQMQPITNTDGEAQ
mgnify:CR=1 FL=1